MDSGWQGGDVFFLARDLGPERRAALLDRAGNRRSRRTNGAASRLPGKDLSRWDANRLPDEQLLGRRAPQLPRRSEPPNLGGRPQEQRSGVAALDRFEGRRSLLGGR